MYLAPTLWLRNAPKLLLWELQIVETCDMKPKSLKSCFVNYPSDAQLVMCLVQEKVQAALQVLQHLASHRKWEAS